MNRTVFLELLGELPKSCDLAIEVMEQEQCEGFVRQKIRYSAEEGEQIPAYLCIPNKIDFNLPAIFCHHQHGGNHLLGKSEVVGVEGDSTQAYAKELAERGYVTLSPDAIAFEERGYASDPDGFHHHLLKTRLLRGETLLGKTLHDISAGVSVLEQLEYVDSQRIGFIGHSYGGRAALFAPVFDSRIIASVSVCGCSSFQSMLDNETGIQPDYCVPEFLKHGDIPDVVKLFKGCSLCLIAATDDKWSLNSGEIEQAAKHSFVDTELFVQTYESTHVFNDAMKQDAYAFLDRILW